MADNFECVSSFTVLDSIAIQKYRSKRTGIQFCFAQVPGPVVNGFLCLGWSFPALHYDQILSLIL